MCVCVRIWLTKCVRPYSVAGCKGTNRKSRHDYGDDDDENNVDANALERECAKTEVGVKGVGDKK